MSVITGYAATQKTTLVEPVTCQPFLRSRVALDTLPPGVVVIITGKIQSSNGTKSVVTFADASLAQRGRILTCTSGANAGLESIILSVSGGDVTLADPFPNNTLAGDTYSISEYKYLTLDSAGNLVVSAQITDPITSLIPDESALGVVTREVGSFSYNDGGEFSSTYTYLGVGGYDIITATRYPIPLASGGASVLISGSVTTASPITGIATGRTTVTTAGTRVVLAASTACKKIDIQALASNTDVVVIGGTSVVAAIGTRQGIALYPGDTYTIDIDNLNDVNLDSVVSGEGVSYTYYT